MPLVVESIKNPVSVHEDAAAKPVAAFRNALAALLGAQRFNLWFAESLIRYDETKLVFSVKNRFAVDVIRSNFHREIEQASLTVFGKTLPGDFIVAPPAISNPPKPVSPSIPRPHSPILLTAGAVGESLKPKTTAVSRPVARRFASLETFVEGLSNRLACRAATLAVEHPGQINPIYLHGPTSIGKTHLLEGIWSAVRQQQGQQYGQKPLYMTAEQFISAFLENIQPGSARDGIQSFRNRFKGISVLLIDDIQHFARKNATQMELLSLMDTLRNQGVQLVFTGDQPPKELKGLLSEIICRLESGMVCGIELPEREMSLKIFQNMVAQRRLPIGPDVCRMVTSRLGVHARQLCGALNRLHAVYLMNGEPITLQVAEETLGDLIRTSRRDIRLQDIDRAVCDTFGLSEQSLQSKSRTKQITAARMLAMWLARKYTRSALSEIGKYFGDRSHSTVVTAQKKVDQWVDEKHPIHDEENLNIAETIRKIERLLQAG